MARKAKDEVFVVDDGEVTDVAVVDAAADAVSIVDTLDAGQERLINVWAHANQAGWLTLTGLDPHIMDEGVTLAPDDEDKIVLFVSGMGDAASWARGDFALYVRGKVRAKAKEEGWSAQKYNELWGTELERMARRFGVSPKTLQNNISTCIVWDHPNRVAGEYVRYKHHEALPTDMELENKHHLLRLCEENGWTWARLYKVAHGKMLEDGTPIDGEEPKPSHFLNGLVPVDEQIANNRPQDMDELDILDAGELIAEIDLPRRETGYNPADGDDDVALPEMPDIPEAPDDLPAEWGDIGAAPLEGHVHTQWGSVAPRPEGQEWVTITMLDGDISTVLVQHAQENPRFRFFFGDNSVFEVTADVALGTIRVESI